MSGSPQARPARPARFLGRRALSETGRGRGPLAIGPLVAGRAAVAGSIRLGVKTSPQPLALPLARYRSLAQECIEAANAFPPGEERNVLLEMAEVWQRLADQYADAAPAFSRLRQWHKL